MGPGVAEGLGKAVTRMYRSLNVNVTVSKGKITTVTLPPAQALNGAVLAGVNPVRIQLQPVYYRSPYQNENDRAATDITLIVVHQTEAAADIGATLRYFTETRPDSTSAHYVISPEAAPQAVKVVQDTGRPGRRARTPPGGARRRSITIPSASSCRTRQAHRSRPSRSTVWSI